MSNMGKGVGHRRRPDVEPRGHSTKIDLVAAKFDFKRLRENFLNGRLESQRNTELSHRTYCSCRFRNGSIGKLARRTPRAR